MRIDVKARGRQKDALAQETERCTKTRTQANFVHSKRAGAEALGKPEEKRMHGPRRTFVSAPHWLGQPAQQPRAAEAHSKPKALHHKKQYGQVPHLQRNRGREELPGLQGKAEEDRDLRRGQESSEGSNVKSRERGPDDARLKAPPRFEVLRLVRDAEQLVAHIGVLLWR